jgi:hypothetical protein
MDVTAENILLTAQDVTSELFNIHGKMYHVCFAS